MNVDYWEIHKEESFLLQGLVHDMDSSLLKIFKYANVDQLDCYYFRLKSIRKTNIKYQTDKLANEDKHGQFGKT